MSEQRVSLNDVARTFLKIGALAYGGPAIMGVMQLEIQERRQWIDKRRFVEGLTLVTMLPGPGATQLAIFIGHATAGIRGGIVAGLCFMLPAFAIMLALAAAYAAWGALPWLRGAFYGIGPVVVGIFAVAVYRLGRNAIKDRAQIAIAVATLVAMVVWPGGIVPSLMLAGCAGIALFDSRRRALVALAIVLGAFAALSGIDAMTPSSPALQPASSPTLVELAAFFVKVGAFTFGGGLSMIAFIEEQLVNQLGWLTHREFVDGLALGQLTPGPILMLAAFIGFRLHGVAGAATAAAAIFVPSFVMMLTLLPLLRRVGGLGWLKAFMRGVAPAVIAALAVSIAQIAPHAAPDALGWVLLAAAVALTLWGRVRPLPLMAAGATLGFMLTATRAVDRLRVLVH